MRRLDVMLTRLRKVLENGAPTGSFTTKNKLMLEVIAT